MHITFLVTSFNIFQTLFFLFDCKFVVCISIVSLIDIFNTKTKPRFQPQPWVSASSIGVYKLFFLLKIILNAH